MSVVKLFAGLRKIAGTKEISLTGASVGALLSGLVSLKPALAEHLLEPHPDAGPGNLQLRRHVIITINGHPTTELEAPLAEHDQIAIFPPITGG
jgi:molybdopterin converting factor small subunit